MEVVILFQPVYFMRYDRWRHTAKVLAFSILILNASLYGETCHFLQNVNNSKIYFGLFTPTRFVC